MHQKISGLFLFGLLLMSSGCATILMHTDKDFKIEDINVYRGVRIDSTTASYVSQSEPLLSVACIFDVPLSAVADTLFLPYDLTQINKRERPDRADPATFVWLKGCYSKDKSNVFCWQFVIGGADPKSFVVLSRDGWARDQSEAYRWWRPLGVEDVSTFSLVKGMWAKDSRAYYATFPDGKYATFSPDGKFWGKVDCDYSTLQVLDGYFAKDKNRAYYCGKPISDVDVASFRAIDHEHAVDKFAKYNTFMRDPKTQTE